MIISGFKSTEIQHFLFEEPLRGVGHTRTVIGNFFEQLTCSVLGTKRHKTDNRANYCPDSSNGLIYYETKAVGCSGEAFVYQGRLGKDKLFSQTNELFYAIWHHQLKTKGITTVAKLERALRLHTRALYLVPFHTIDKICSNSKLEKLNSKYGRAQDYPCVYGAGFRFKLSQLALCLHKSWPHGLNFSSLPEEIQ